MQSCVAEDAEISFRSYCGVKLNDLQLPVCNEYTFGNKGVRCNEHGRGKVSVQRPKSAQA